MAGEWREPVERTGHCRWLPQGEHSLSWRGGRWTMLATYNPGENGSQDKMEVHSVTMESSICKYCISSSCYREKVCPKDWFGRPIRQRLSMMSRHDGQVENRGYLFVYICADVLKSFCTSTLSHFWVLARQFVLLV